jgi:hypothetical protein
MLVGSTRLLGLSAAHLNYRYVQRACHMNTWIEFYDLEQRNRRQKGSTPSLRRNALLPADWM